MASLVIHHETIDNATAEKLIKLCPFSAIAYTDGRLHIDAGCKMCMLCVKKGPPGAVTLADDRPRAALDKNEWRGVAVFVEHQDGQVHNVTLELIGKARELAAVTGHPVYALLVGSGVDAAAHHLLRYGVDTVFVYDRPELAQFRMEPYAAAFADFIEKGKPSSILVGATNVGRSLAPRVAARFRTGLTADCTVLQMKETTDLVQIRPAFGGNIMAQIVTPRHRPQFCTVRYKIFSAPEAADASTGVVLRMTLPAEALRSSTEILKIEEKPKQIDISEARVIVAVGRGFQKEADLDMARELADLLGAQMACTRPLIENCWLDARRQIGLSGRTVGAELIVALGVSGSVQFAAGMRGCGCIVAVNQDPHAPIFGIAHYAVVGDLYDILPRLVTRSREVQEYGLQHAVTL